MENGESGKARGGYARAEQLTPAERSAIAKKGAMARWNIDAEEAVGSGEIQIGDSLIPCAVLPGGIRVLSERALTKAFGGKRGGSHWKRMKADPDGANLPVFLSAKNIRPFIVKDLTDGLNRRHPYKPKGKSGAALGIEAGLLPKICKALLSVRDAGASLPAQDPIIKQADIIMRGLAEVGIIALVDEATGYIDEKKKTEYRDLFREFIRQECREWEKEFPEQFTDMIYRLYKLAKGKQGRHPRFFGKFIRKYIYAPLAGSNGVVLAMLDEKNPVVYANGRRRYKMHQFLTAELGLPAIRGHIWQVVGIGNASNSKENFDRGFRRAFPQIGITGDLFADLEGSD
ncbi:MAG: P63C domain-containing protein [Nitrospirales bacterium]